MSRRSKTESGGNTVDREVASLIAMKDKSQLPNQMLALRHKYRDAELIQKIEQVFAEKHRSIVKRAKKFADAFRSKYAHADLPYHQLLAKAKAHAKKHHFSGDEFEEFRRMYEQELSGTNKANEVVVPLTNLMKVLGNLNLGVSGQLNVEEADYKNVQEIIKDFETTKPLHAQALLQSLQYEDLAFQGLTAIIDRTQHNPGEHVHPVIAAMFLPKMELFESHFLYSNIAGIVKSRYNQEPMTTRPDYELFYSLVTDPNDIVCDNRTPVGDLLNRCRLQQHLWNSVLSLRNGQVYNKSFREFIVSVDNCKLNKFDNPDFAYGRHDGTVIKRLLSAFSFRPTVVATLPIAHVFSANPYAQNVRPTVTSVPMINVRLHAYQNVARNAIGGLAPGGVGSNRQPPVSPVALSGCLIQTQTFIEGNMLVQRISDVVYSREVLIFYVDRRAHLLQYGSPFNIAKLPSAVAGFERINEYPIELECEIKIRQGGSGDTFCLRSVVVAEVSTKSSQTDPRSIVIGSSAFIVDWPELIVDGKPSGIKKCGTLEASQAAIGSIANATGPGFNQSNQPQAGATNNALGPNANLCDNAIALYHYDPANALVKHSPHAIYDILTGPVAGGAYGGQPGALAPGWAPSTSTGTVLPIIQLAQQLVALQNQLLYASTVPRVQANVVALRGPILTTVQDIRREQARLGTTGATVAQMQQVALLEADGNALITAAALGNIGAVNAAAVVAVLDIPATVVNLTAAFPPTGNYDPPGTGAATWDAARGLRGPEAPRPLRPTHGNAEAIAAYGLPINAATQRQGVPPALTPLYDGLSKKEAEDRMRKQGVIFIYQNFNYKSWNEAGVTL